MKLDRALVDRLAAEVVGRRDELEGVVAALAAGRHLLLDGPPGTGKSTLLRAVAEAVGHGFEFVEGNAELTPARLIGTFDPARVITEGYTPGIFIDGPLTAALRAGALLYLEEINRIPEETLNVLVTVMSEGELQVPRLGRVVAAPGFRLVAAMNPFDAVGTARISGAVYDRCCRLAMGYQPAGDEHEILRHRTGHQGPLVSPTVAMVRDTREHPDLRTGSSVRGAVDTVLLAEQLAALRAEPITGRRVTLDAARLALSGRIRLREGSTRTPEEVIEELWRRHLEPLDIPAADGSGADSDADPPDAEEATDEGATEGATDDGATTTGRRSTPHERTPGKPPAGPRPAT